MLFSMSKSQNYTCELSVAAKRTMKERSNNKLSAHHISKSEQLTLLNAPRESQAKSAASTIN